MSKCADYQKCVILLVDEVHIKDDLVFDKHFDLGNTNNQLMDFEKSIMGEQESQLATSMIMLMVRGSCVSHMHSFLHLLQLETCFLIHCGMQWPGLNGVV